MYIHIYFHIRLFLYVCAFLIFNYVSIYNYTPTLNLWSFRTYVSIYNYTPTLNLWSFRIRNYTGRLAQTHTITHTCTPHINTDTGKDTYAIVCAPHTRTYTHTLLVTHMNTPTYTQIDTLTNMQRYTRTHAHTNTRTSKHALVHTNTRKHTHTQTYAIFPATKRRCHRPPPREHNHIETTSRAARPNQSCGDHAVLQI